MRTEHTHQNVQSPPPSQPSGDCPRREREDAEITPGRCLKAGLWAFAVLWAAAKLSEGAMLFLSIPLLGLPWLLYLMNDRVADNRSVGTGEAIITGLAGCFISLVCAVPFAILYGFLTSFAK